MITKEDYELLKKHLNKMPGCSYSMDLIIHAICKAMDEQKAKADEPE